MTREEAIKILKSGSTFAYDEKEAGDFCEAYDMAVKALEAQDVDAISRQAVMWMLTNLSYTQCKTQGEAEVIGLAKTMLIAMPSAQASYRQVAGKLDITDCISRQAAIDALDALHYNDREDWCFVMDTVEFLPSVQPEPDWTEIMVICDNCGHAVHAKRENCKVSAQPEPSQVARDIATILENEKDMRVMLQPEPQWIPCSDCERKCDKWENSKT